MQTISTSYCDLNAKLHADNPYYGVSGSKYAHDVMRLALEFKTCDILDYGCGKNKLAHNLPFIIKKYDPAIAKYSELPEPADIVVCTDVLEHIEPELLDNVLNHLKSLIKKIGFFVIATRPAKKILDDGRNAHLIIQPMSWWLNKLIELFEIRLLDNRKGEFVVAVEPKQEVKNAENA